MQINITTDYAIRIVYYLAKTERITTSIEIAEEMSIPANYVPNIVKKLRSKDLIDAVFGPKGGYRLAKDPKEITLLDVIGTMEGSIRLNRCLEDDHFCSRNGVGTCPVHEVYKEAQLALEKVFQSKSIADLLNEEK